MSTKEVTVSDVWKDGKNEKDGVKLDLVAHLKNANNRPEAIKMKHQALDLFEFEKMDNPIILDVGCGIGCDIIRMAGMLEIANKSGSITGIDFNTEMVNAAKELTAKEITYEQVSVNIEKMDATEMNIEDATFDVAFISCTLQHISPTDTEKVLSEIHRVLKPDGKIVIIEPEQSALKFYTPNSELKVLVDKMFTGIHMANASVGSGLNWILPNHGFQVEVIESISNVAVDLTSSDPGWIKLNGMTKMAVEKGVLTQEEADKYVPLYSKAAEDRKLMCSSLVFIYKAHKVTIN